ncbi:MAG TPA: DUF692 domain-containing protein [Polyangiaceae bacterium]|nr:DUF692 domain-containing protein [Polyangiaceae bacterium]
METDRFGLPQLGFGVGLRTVHYEHILRERPRLGWFEVLSDNYLHTRGRPLDFLDQIADRYPVALHGVGLSIGSTDPLNLDYLAQLKALRDRVGAHWVSDHICWTGVNGRYGHDLYPIPFTEEALRHVARRVRQVQDYLEAPLVLENPSTYLDFRGSTLREAEFISALLDEADAGLLLDVNNVYVNSHNHGFDPLAYLQQLPMQRVVQLHVAGHSQARGYLADTHSAPVAEPVWALLEQAVQLGARAPVLLEWDAEIPSFDVLERELGLAQACCARAS